MSKPKYRSFTIRVPDDLYLALAKAAQADQIFLNQKANQLLRLGLGQHISLDNALRALLLDRMAGATEGAPV